MRYSVLGNTGLRVSALGFGCMRLPMKNEKVDRDLAIPLLHRAVELGVNFFDSAIGYCNSDSQRVLGEAFQDGLRQKVVLSTKNSLPSASDSEWWRALETSLRLMQTDCLDLYHHHGISWDEFVKIWTPAKNGKTRLMFKAKEQGLIKHIGFSFHDTPANLRKLVDTGYYENVILQYNLLDEGNAEMMHYAHEKGLGVVVMGPVGGGRLGLPSETIAGLTNGAARSTPEAALRFVWAHPAVQVALSGMRNLAQLEENVALAEHTEPFTKEQVAALDTAITARKKKSGLYCTACKYCLPACAAGVSIPENLDCLNALLIYGLKEHAQGRYARLSGKAAYCVNCGKCMPLCPQNIKIPEKLRETALLLDVRAGSVCVDTALETVAPDGDFRLKLGLHNFAAGERAIRVAVTGTGNTRLNPIQKDLGIIPPFARHTLLIEGVADRERKQITLGIDTACEGVTRHIDTVYDYLFIAEGEPQGWDGAGWLARQADEADFTEQKESARLHGLRFKLARVREGLLLLADVRDDFLFPSRADAHKGLTVDGLEVYLDGREAAKLGRSNYEKHVHQLFLYPGTPGQHPAFYQSPQGLTDVTVTSEGTAHGYRMRAFIPFASFCAAKGTPRKIGFDIGVNTADREGKRIGLFTFTGGRNNWRDASAFREAWLV